jgi:predicted amidohydrolase YtcJ
MKSKISFIFFFMATSVFAQRQTADLIIYNANIYTVNSRFDVAKAFAVKDDRILAIGSDADIFSKFQAKTTFDAAGKTILPGLIDAHTHFYRYGEALQTVDLVGTKSWEESLQKCTDFAKKNTEGWLVGRGWDQNDWAIKEYPTKEQLDKLFPKRPAILVRVDGHAAVVNQTALDMAKIQAGQTLTGGEIETKNGQLTGVLIDNAMRLVSDLKPETNDQQRRQAFLDAQKNCFAVGLTTVVDCGVNAPLIDFIEKMNLDKSLKMRLYLMLSDDRDNYEYLFKRGIVKTDRLHVRSFKLYADGALGSRGACLLHPYSDRPNHFGFLLKDTAYYSAVTKRIAEHEGMQACTHAIGDSANREILRIYGDVLRGPNDRRWRIEHAQVINQEDFPLFKKYNIIPSVQPTHATSDMYWAGDRLGKEREVGAYAFHKLMEQNGWLPLGTDFPVEDINPILTFYAAVVRKDVKGFPEGGYQTINALNREQALRGMTIWAAKANFEEKEKGSLEVGKFADFIILNQNIMEVAPLDILKTKVLATFVGGEKVFGL